MIDKYVLTTFSGKKFILSENEKKIIIQNILQDRKGIDFKKNFIPLRPAPEIIDLRNWVLQENERLLISGLKRCKICLTAHDRTTKCPCMDGQKTTPVLIGQDQLALKR